MTYTSNLPGAGTDANVYVDIRGQLGSTGKQVLKNASLNPFERAQVRGAVKLKRTGWCSSHARPFTLLHPMYPSLSLTRPG